MKTVWLRSVAACLSFALAGCAGVGVMATSDPMAKLADAGSLFEEQDRPLIAERLIREAIAICESKPDQSCLAEGYRTYGFFFRSPSISGKWAKHYQENGFLESSATFDNRYQKSIEYFDKALQISTQLERFDEVTSANLNMGFTYELMGQSKLACQAFEASSVSHRENLRRNPNARVHLPKGYATYDDFLLPQKKRAQCV